MKALIVGNWKMNPATSTEARALLTASKQIAEKSSAVSLVIAPPALYLQDLIARYKGKKLGFAVQSARPEKVTAITGGVSLAQVKELRVSWAIIGHAERRALGESDDDTRAQIAAALTLKMNPILCVGEKERDDTGGHFRTIASQIKHACDGLEASQIGKIVIAYEPVWKIGAQNAMSPNEMHEMSIFIRKTLVEIAPDAAMKMKILYGGSIDTTSAPLMMQHGDVAGLLIGRASLESTTLREIVRAIDAL